MHPLKLVFKVENLHIFFFHISRFNFHSPPLESHAHRKHHAHRKQNFTRYGNRIVYTRLLILLLLYPRPQARCTWRGWYWKVPSTYCFLLSIQASSCTTFPSFISTGEAPKGELLEGDAGESPVGESWPPVGDALLAHSNRLSVAVTIMILMSQVKLDFLTENALRTTWTRNNYRILISPGQVKLDAPVLSTRQSAMVTAMILVF